MQSTGTCFICQKRKKKDKCRSTKDGHMHLSTILPEFQKNDRLPFCLDKLKGNYDILEKEAKRRRSIIKSVITIIVKKNLNGRKKDKINPIASVTRVNNYVAYLNLQEVGIPRTTISANSIVVFILKQTQKIILQQQVFFIQQKIKLI